MNEIRTLLTRLITRFNEHDEYERKTMDRLFSDLRQNRKDIGNLQSQMNNGVRDDVREVKSDVEYLKKNAVMRQPLDDSRSRTVNIVVIGVMALAAVPGWIGLIITIAGGS